MLEYLKFAIAISFISWLVGMMLNSLLMKTAVYNKLSHLNFIKSKTLNKYIGMEYFKWVVLNTLFKFFNQKISLKDKNLDITEIRNEMTIAEISHLIGFIFVTFFAVYKGYSQTYTFALVIMAVNVLMNLYPSLLQQKNKRRLDLFIKKRTHKHES